MYYSYLSTPKHIALSLCTLVGIICLTPAAPAQEKGMSFLPAPPPLKSVSRNERTQLDSARDTKTRMRATIEMADARLARAEQLTAGQQYDTACEQLGSYQGLIENFLSFLDKSEPRKDKIRDVLKRLEIALRLHSARIEAIRRTTPAEHAVNVRAILDFAYSARTEALNSFFGNATINDADPGMEKPLEDPAQKVTITSTADNQP